MMGSSSVEARTGSSLFIFLLCAISECLLICMLLVDSIFSFFITKFASIWKLPTPCLLCSRLDHVFGFEKRGYLWKLICCKHKLEISSLVLCHAHNKLVNVHEMCETCLFSFASINKLNSETCRLLVGKLGEVPHLGIDRDPLLGDQKHDDTLSERRCSCCNEPYVPRGFVQTLIKTRSSELEIGDLDVPSSAISSFRCKEDFHESSSNPLPHVQSRELKITSDTESDGNGITLGVETTNSKDYLTDQGVHMEPNFISLASSLTSTKLVETPTAPEPLVFEPRILTGDTPPPVECGVEIDHGLDESTPKHVEPNAVFSSPTDLLSLDEMIPSSNTMETSVEALDESYVTTSEEYKTECRETEKAEILLTKATSEVGSEDQPVSINVVQMAPNVLELGDAYKLTTGARGGRQLSSKLSEKWIGKDSSKVSEDLKLFLTQLSFNRSNDQSRDMSPRLSINGDDPRNFDVLSAAGMQVKRFPLERNVSGLESFDGSIVSEMEGENLVDQLKRQIEYDKMLMSSLYKELDEERNASAIAANQTMAMITRLQEEKASLHMEALQCIRMMEEQGEYDDDALQKANDLITEKDKEIQDLEAELEFYRINFPNAYTIDNLVKTSNVKERDIRVVHLESNEMGTSGYENSVAGKPDIHEKFGSDGSTYNNLLLEFEDEKLDIRQRLKKLENMLHLFSNNGVKIDLSNGECLGSISSGENDLDSDNRKLEDGEDRHAEEGRLPSLASPTFDKESGELDCSDRNLLLANGMADFASIRSEISNLNKRMEVLEADKNFLEHTINSLRKGEEGLQFVQEIASHLRKLREVGIRS